MLAVRGIHGEMRAAIMVKVNSSAMDLQYEDSTGNSTVPVCLSMAVTIPIVPGAKVK